MKIFYELPDSTSELESKMIALLYENYKLNMMWNLRKIEDEIKKENGSIYIDRVPASEEDAERLDIRLEGFSERLIIVIRGLLAGYQMPA